MNSNTREVVFYKNLAYLRQKAGLSQGALADKLDVSRSKIGAHEERRSEPSLAFLCEVATLFGVSVDDILKKDIRAFEEPPVITKPEAVRRFVFACETATRSSVDVELPFLIRVFEIKDRRGVLRVSGDEKESQLIVFTFRPESPGSFMFFTKTYTFDLLPEEFLQLQEAFNNIGKKTAK